jgi:hypothetical protein
MFHTCAIITGQKTSRVIAVGMACCPKIPTPASTVVPFATGSIFMFRAVVVSHRAECASDTRSAAHPSAWFAVTTGRPKSSSSVAIAPTVRNPFPLVQVLCSRGCIQHYHLLICSIAPGEGG